MSFDKSQAHNLADYLHRRLQYLESCYNEIENKLTDDELDLCRNIDEGKYDKNDPGVGKIIFHLEYVVGNTFRYTMLVGICSFLEEAIKTITKYLVPNYEASLKDQKKGNWLRKHICLLCDFVGFNAVEIQSDLDKFHDLITLRNCIIHSWGKLTEDPNADSIRRAAQQIESVEISKNNFLMFSDPVVPEAIITAEKIADYILTACMNV
jgi:hypothetical protein